MKISNKSYLPLLFLLLISSLQAQVNFTIVTTVIDEDDGELLSGAGTSLREAINHSAAGTTITFNPTLNGETINLSLGELQIEQETTIDASLLADGITINGGGNSDFIANSGETRCFFISDGDESAFYPVEFRNLTIQNGSFSGANAGANIHNREMLTLSDCQILNGRSFGNDNARGGGIYHHSGQLTMTRCIISGNQTNGESAEGGGIHNEGGTVALTDCTLTGNQTLGDSADGGGINSFNGSLTLMNCVLTQNQTRGNSAQGGAIHAANTTLTCTDTTISNNETRGAFADGGGIYGQFGSSTLNGCTISGNQTIGRDAQGGGVHFVGVGGSMNQLINCTIAGNIATNTRGGGISNESPSLMLEHCTIIDNTSEENTGAGITCAEGRTATLSYCIVRDNVGGFDLGHFSYNSLNSYRFSGTNIVGTIDDDVLGVTPNAEPLLFVSLGNYGGLTQTMIPLPGSPAIDGAIGSSRTEDQRGLMNVGVADIGATEFQGNSDLQLVAPVIWNLDFDGDGNPYGVEFALGTDPLIADFSDPASFALQLNASNQTVLSFGYNEDAVGTAVWILERSSDLTPNSWVELIRSENPEEATTFTDLDSESLPHQFYRFSVELIVSE